MPADITKRRDWTSLFSDLWERLMRINGFLMTALIALGVVAAYDKYGKSSGMRRAA